MSTKKRTLVISKCQHGSFSISVDYGDGTGHRVTPGNCCGYWRTLKSFSMRARDWEELGLMASDFAEEMRESADVKESLTTHIEKFQK